MRTTNDYIVQKTRKGDFIIRDRADRQLARFDAENKAIHFIEKLVEKINNERKQIEIENEKREKLFRSFNSRQIKWQEFRNELYNVLCWKSKNNEKIMRNIKSDRKQHIVLKSMKRTEELDVLYQQAVDIDTRLKNARYEMNIVNYIAILEIAEKFIIDNENYYA